MTYVIRIVMACNTSCGSKDNCPEGVCPDFVIRRHDTRPVFRIKVEDCDGPLDLTDLVLEATMWTTAKLKTAITIEDEYFALADNIGFDQIMVGDVLIMDRARLPEHMLVTAFDETNYLVKVQRGYHSTPISAYKRGSGLKIMKFISAAAVTEMEIQDVAQIDCTVLEDQLIASYFVYEWQPIDTCLPGCYYLEFKLLKMTESEMMSSLSVSSSVTPSFTDPDFTSDDFHCGLGAGVEWARRFPVDGPGFLIKVTDSPSAEL